MSQVAESKPLSVEQKRSLVAKLLRQKAGHRKNVASLVHRRIEMQAAQTPEAIALTCGGESLTYRAMNTRANRLARRLRALGVGPEVLVALCVGRSTDMVVGLLAILKAGGAYVPLDPAFPAERLTYMLDDARAPVLLTEEKLLGVVPADHARVVCLDSERAVIAAENDANLDVELEASNLAYVIYTSGSTGKPKGVQVTHGAIANLLESMRSLMSIHERDALLAVTTLSFDIAALEIYLPLIVGARVELIDRDMAADAARLAERLDDRGITFLQATPATWRLLLEGGWRGKPSLTMLCGGEALSRTLADQLIDKGGALWNVYGPTETTVWSSAWEVEAGDVPISIGRPLANTRLYVLDHRLRAVPAGIVGELYIGGAGLARGYRNLPALTAERFIPDPFGGTRGGQLYRTGDLARWRHDGSLECLGRIDHQVKVRGFRIELGEIEAALASHSAVREAAVSARPDLSGEMSLAAYVALRGRPDPHIATELRNWLRGTLPEYMVPGAFVFVDGIPLTPNGKVDRGALPDPGRAHASPGAGYVPPCGPIEEALAELWTELLGGERVGAHDNFFERGGHSLLAVQLLSRLRQTFGVEGSLPDFLEEPTISRLARIIKQDLETGTVASAPPLVPVDRGVPLPASFAQQRLWFLDQLQPGLASYHIPAAVKLVGRLDTVALERALNEVVRRHEALRTTLVADGGVPYQVIPERLHLPLFIEDLSSFPENERELRAGERIRAEAERPFDLSRGPLVRAALLRLGEQEHIAMVTMHHAVSDGWSIGILIREFGALYQSFVVGEPSPLAEPIFQYADYTVWHRNCLEGPVLDAHLSYWTRQLAGVLDLELPTDRPRPPVASQRGGDRSIILPLSTLDAVRALGRHEGATLYMTLLAGFQVLLFRYSGQEDFAVGTPIAGRSRPELEGLIGFFVNTLVVRGDMSGGPGFRELLRRVRKTAIEAFTHQEIPFDKLVTALERDRDASRTPIFQAMFALQNAPSPTLQAPGLLLTPIDLPSRTAKFDLTLFASEVPEVLRLTMEYSTDLFDATRVDGMLADYRLLLEEMIAQPDLPIGGLRILTDLEPNSLREPNSPSANVVLEALPPTSNGRVDRVALPAAGWVDERLIAVTAAPRGPIEEVVASVWETVLRLDRVGADERFFDIGGHSLLAAQVIAQLRAAFGVDIPLRTLFDAPTVAGLAEQIEMIRRGGARRESTPIEPTESRDPVPLSLSQEALWFLDQLAPGQPTFNVTAALRIKGPLDRAAFERSLNELDRRHASLRTSFIATAGTPHQVIDSGVALALDTVDLTDLPLEQREDTAQRFANSEFRRPFDLTHAPLARACLLRLGDRDHAVVLTMHHLITDGWSFGVAASELAMLYEADRQGHPSPLPDPPIQYADFARWQRGQFESGAWSAQIESWRRRLASVPALELPTDRPRPPIRTARGAQLPLVLSPELSTAIRALARREGVTPFMTLLAAYQLVLARWSGQDDFAVGAPVANRGPAETERLIGYFVNMVALRTDLSGNPTVREFLARVREVALEAFENQAVPLEALVAAIGPRRDASRSPLFQVMFVLQNNALPVADSLDLAFSPLVVDEGTGTSKFDLSLGFDDSPEGFSGSVEFNVDLFEPATIAHLATHYVKVLEYLIADPERPLSELSLLSDAERRRVMSWSREPDHAPETARGARSGAHSAIHGMFQAQVRNTPDALALVAGDERLTYAALNARANQLAHYLVARGVGPEVRVGLLVEGLIDQIVTVLGVLKAGAAYVPVEPSLAAARTEVVLIDASVAIVIGNHLSLERTPRTSALLIDLDAARSDIENESALDPPLRVDGANLAYLIFTSGSTGRPKGVMVSHGNLVAAAGAWAHTYELRQPPLRHLQAAGFAFDVFTGDWVRALTTGGTLVACPQQVLIDPAALADLIRRERIECLELVPAVADVLATHLENKGENLFGVRLLAVGSDTVRRRLYRRLCRLVGPGGRVVNSYGLTEATIDSTCWGDANLDLEAEDGPVPIGRPLPGTRAYILDGQGKPVPMGIVGELFIGGSGVARGYAGSPRLTAERFVPDPHGDRGSRMYATGDRARWRAGGVVELLGRRDGQLKVRGFRIEIAEIEAAIGSWPGVREAAVVAQEDGADGQRLIACIANDEGTALDVEPLRRFLRARLPRPMIPSQFQIVESLPRTHSGKVDRRRLSESLPDQVARIEALILPRDAVEAQLAAIWEDLLQVRPIGVTDDFFDLGGHSLLAVRLAARIEEAFGQSLALSDLLVGPTIEELAARLREPVGSRRGSPLIALDAAGPGQPLVLVHPIGGGVLCYNALARCLDGTRSVLGLQAAGLEGEAEPETDLVRMATRYVDTLRTARPVGPYILGGWSMGGVVAFEMARQLAAAGHDVPLVILIDCSVPAPRMAAPRTINELESLAAFAADLARTAGRDDWASPERVRGLDPESLRNGTFEQTALGREIASEIGIDRLRRLHDVFRANCLALDAYRPRSFAGRVILVEAGSCRNHRDDWSTRGWNDLALAGVSTHHVAGDHYTIMQQPAVARLAEILSHEMERYERAMGEILVR